MKKYILFLCALGLLSSCFKDDSTVAKEENRATEIVVEGLRDTSVVSFSTTLELTPTVPGYTDDELSFAWYIYGGEFEDQTEDGYRTVSIGNEKTLVYPVELKTGTYTVVCEATHKETMMPLTRLTVVTMSRITAPLADVNTQILKQYSGIAILCESSKYPSSSNLCLSWASFSAARPSPNGLISSILNDRRPPFA